MELRYDAIIIGGGPAGSTTGYYLAKAGFRVLIVEKSQFPRYCIGESLLPYNMEIFRDMAFDSILEREQFMVKRGAIFGSSSGKTINRIAFENGLESEYSYAYQVPRDRFDFLLLTHAKEQGLEVLQGAVLDVIQEGTQIVGVRVRPEGEQEEQILKSRVVIDASGRRFFIAKKFDLLVPDPQINSVAVFGLFENIPWLPNAQKGDIMILAFEEGWFWFIPFSDGRVSVGVVTDLKFYNRYAENPLDTFFYMMVEKAGGRVQNCMREAKSLEKLNLLQQFSKHASKKSGPGWVLVGDAAMFVDPVYSAGVLMAMHGGRDVAQLTIEAFQKNEVPSEKHYERYEHHLKTAYNTILPFIYHFRKPFFQKILFHPPEDGKYLKLVITVLSGCFFKPDLTEVDHRNFWKFVYFCKIWDQILSCLTFRKLRLRIKSSRMK